MNTLGAVLRLGTLRFLAVALCSPSLVLAGNATSSSSPVICKDGTTSGHAGRGACSGHGGVDKSATAASTSTSTSAHSATTIASASPQSARQTAATGGGSGKVWVNTQSKVYHCPSDRWYGKTKQGEYMSEAEAKAQGFRADHNKPCS
jgi:hypothetical protein